MVIFMTTGYNAHRVIEVDDFTMNLVEGTSSVWYLESSTVSGVFVCPKDKIESMLISGLINLFPSVTDILRKNGVEWFSPRGIAYLHLMVMEHNKSSLNSAYVSFMNKVALVVKMQIPFMDFASEFSKDVTERIFMNILGRDFDRYMIDFMLDMKPELQSY